MIFEFLKNISSKSENDVERAFIEKAETLEQENSQLRKQLEASSQSDLRVKTLETEMVSLQAKYDKLKKERDKLASQDASPAAQEPNQGLLVGNNNDTQLSSFWERSYELKA